MTIPKFAYCFVLALNLGFTHLALSQLCNVVSPPLTDAQINTYTNFHTWCYNSSNQRGKLFVFFPGTEGVPFVYQQIVRAAASNGFHSIGLMYPNDTEVVEACAFVADVECNKNIRLEIVTGTNFSDRISVNRANSIENRLIKLIQYLHNAVPSRQWGQFLNSQTNIVWSNVVVAGHSQGGGHAMLLAKLHQVHRCLMFASMDWRFLPTEGVPSWVSEPGLTSPDRYFGLGHYDDEVVAFERLLANWQALTIDQFALEHLVDGSSPSYGASHMLTTDLPSTNPHSCMISDLAMITNGSGSVYLPVWQWMLIGPTVLPELVISNQVVVSYEVRPDWQYRLQFSSNLNNYAQIGSTVIGSNGMITAGMTNQPAGFYRVITDY